MLCMAKSYANKTKIIVLYSLRTPIVDESNIVDQSKKKAHVCYAYKSHETNIKLY